MRSSGVLEFWALAATLAAAVTYVVTRPLRARTTVSDLVGSTAAHGPAQDNDTASDLAVYRDQLAELDVEAERGVLSGEDAASARLEISRRMLARAERASAPTQTRDMPAIAALLATASIPLVGLGFYLLAGVPSMPDLPRAARADLPAEQSDVSQLIGRVEERIAKSPEDGKGWDVIAPVYLKQARYADAVLAYDNAIRLLGETVPRLSGLAEAHIKVANGVVNDAAKAANSRILVLDPTRIEPRFWLALALEQDGKLAAAAAAYRAMLDNAPADAPWREPVLARLAAVDPSKTMIASPKTTTAKPPTSERGPSAADITASGQLTPEARMLMIAGMVEGLEQRLAGDGRDADGWQKLIRSYVVMGNKEKAGIALRNARTALAGNQDGLAAVNASAKELGIGS
jgi:cytochrome c-type biogenesis protein CcmH